MTQNNNHKSEEEQEKYWVEVKKICDDNGLNFGSAHDRWMAMNYLDKGIDFRDPESEDPSNEELIEGIWEQVKFSVSDDEDSFATTMSIIRTRFASLNEENQQLKRGNDTLTIDLENRDQSLNLELNKENQRLHGDYCETEFKRVELVFQVAQLTAKIEKGREVLKEIYVMAEFDPEDDSSEAQSERVYIMNKASAAITELEK